MKGKAMKAKVKSWLVGAVLRHVEIGFVVTVAWRVAADDSSAALRRARELWKRGWEDAGRGWRVQWSAPELVGEALAVKEGGVR